MRFGLSGSAAIAVAALGGLPAPAGPTAAVHVVEAISEPSHDLELGFTVPGRVLEVLVRPGDRVKLGDALIRLDDREGAAQVRLFELRSESTLEADAAEAAWKLAVNEEGRVRDAHAKGGAAAFEVERAELESRRSFLAFELFKQRQQETAIQLQQARAQHDRFSLEAPLAGTVEEVLVEPGEMVEETRPVLRLVVIDPLRIDAPAPIGVAAGLAVGGPAWIRFKDAPDAPPLEGRIVNIAAVADPGSETRRVRVEAANPGAMPAGSHVEVVFSDKPAPGAVSSR